MIIPDDYTLNYLNKWLEKRVHKEPIITNAAFDIAVDKAFLELLHDNKDLINITERYKNHE